MKRLLSVGLLMLAAFAASVTNATALEISEWTNAIGVISTHGQRKQMAAEIESVKPRFVLHLHIQVLPENVSSLLSFLRGAVPVYQTPGGIRVRLIQSLSDPTRFIETVEYETREAFDQDQRRVAEDVRVKGLIEDWHTLLAGAVMVEAYQEVTDQT